MLTKLKTPIPLETSKGRAWAVAVIEYGAEWDTQWVTFLHNTGERWTFSSNEVWQEPSIH